MKTTITLLVLSVVCFALAACEGMSTVETIGAIGAGAAALGQSAVELAGIVAPLLPPEKAAKVMTLATDVDTDLGTLKMVAGTLADAITTMTANFKVQMEAAQHTISAQATQIASLPTTTETALIAAGTSAVGGAAVNVHRNSTRAKALSPRS